MKQETKFRGKRIDNGEWITGSYVKCIDRHYICKSIFIMERIENEEDVEEDGEDALYLYGSTNQYFFDLDDVTDYCEGRETQPEELQLVLCRKTHFSPIDWETIQQEQTHEDWEPSKEFEEKVKEFNQWLTSQNTETWVPTNKRIDISLHL